MKFFIASLLILISLKAFGDGSNTCEIKTFPKILFLSQPKSIKNLKRAYNSTTCKHETLWQVFSTLSLIEGSISQNHLNRLLKEDGVSETVQIFPKEITINQIENHISNSLSGLRGYRAKNVKTKQQDIAVGFRKNSFYEVACHGCSNVGEKNASFVYTDPLSGLERKVWIQFDLYKTDRVVIAETDLRPFINQDITHNVKLKATDLKNATDYLKDTENLKYYKPNKVIKKGSPLRYADLVPRTLVQTGKLTQVIVKKGTLSIQTQAISRGSGTLNEIINLHNPQSKKQFRGKIVDFNKVVVEL